MQAVTQLALQAKTLLTTPVRPSQQSTLKHRMDYSLCLAFVKQQPPTDADLEAVKQDPDRAMHTSKDYSPCLAMAAQ